MEFVDPFNANGDDPTATPNQYDIVLVAENRHIYFNRYFLAMHSPKFKRLIYGKHSLPKGSEIRLKDGVKFQVVLSALKLLKLSPDFESVNCALAIRYEELITNANVEALLEFAEEYRLEKVTKFCEAFLVDVFGLFKPNKFKTFPLADTFNLQVSDIGADVTDFITDGNLESILSVATRCQMPHVVPLCEAYLLKFWKLEPVMIVRAVELSAKFGLQNALSNLLKYGKNDISPITCDADLERIVNLADQYSIPEIASDCETYILQHWIARGNTAIRAVEIACELNLPMLAITFIPLARSRPKVEILASTAYKKIMSSTYLKRLRRFHGLSVETKSINDLPSDLLSELFSYLPPTDRLHLSEVCRRFYHVSRKEWLDVTDLDLSSIPAPNIGAILGQTPNLESIFAKDRMLILDDLNEHSLINLTSMRLFDASFASGKVTGLAGFENNYFPPMPTYFERLNIERFGALLPCFFENFPQLDELVLHNVTLRDLHDLVISHVIPLSFPQTLRYSLSKLAIVLSKGAYAYDSDMLTSSLAALTNLECLILRVGILVVPNDQAHVNGVEAAFSNALRALVNLHELSLSVTVCTRDFSASRPIDAVEDAVASLPNLEILFLGDVFFSVHTLAQMITSHSSLRILLITRALSIEVEFLALMGYHGRVIVACRNRFLGGPGTDPLQTLSIFVGRRASNALIFKRSADSASIVRPINKSMPALLADEEIADIFARSWLAERICEGAESEAEIFGYDDAITASVATFI